MHVTSMTVVGLLALTVVVILYKKGSFSLLWQAASGSVSLAA